MGISKVIDLKIRRYIKALRDDGCYTINKWNGLMVKVVGVSLGVNGKLYPLFENGYTAFNNMYRHKNVVYISDVCEIPCDIIASYEV